MINGLPVMIRKLHEYATINPEVGARCRQAVTSLIVNLVRRILTS
jgi:hypothetical protein